MVFVELQDREQWVEKVSPIFEELPDQVTTWVEQIRAQA